MTNDPKRATDKLELKPISGAWDAELTVLTVDRVFCASCEFDDLCVSVIRRSSLETHYSRRRKEPELWRPFLAEHSEARLTPNVPESIRRSVVEAFKCLSISSFAVVVLVRRALQAIIRDYYDVSRKTLNEEISALAQTKGVTPAIVNALHGVRKIGNIGAHPGESVDEEEPLTQADASDMLKALTVVLSLTYAKDFDEAERLNRASELAAEIEDRISSGTSSDEKP